MEQTYIGKIMTAEEDIDEKSKIKGKWYILDSYQ